MADFVECFREVCEDDINLYLLIHTSLQELGVIQQIGLDVDLDLKNPCCSGRITPLNVSNNVSVTMLSRTLDTVQSKEIGL